MSPELDKKLVTKYPKIFVNRHGDMKSTCMCWGFECDDGWYWLIEHLCHSLQWDTDNNNRPGKKDGMYPYPQIVASQVKEKYGALRFYVEGATMEQYAKISFAEALSADICETCGSTKNVGRTNGWIYTRCMECAVNENLISETDFGWKSNEIRESEKNESKSIETT